MATDEAILYIVFKDIDLYGRDVAEVAVGIASRSCRCELDDLRYDIASKSSSTTLNSQDRYTEERQTKAIEPRNLADPPACV